MDINRDRISTCSCFSWWHSVSVSDSGNVGYDQPECLYDECNIEWKFDRIRYNSNICNCDSSMCYDWYSSNVQRI